MAAGVQEYEIQRITTTQIVEKLEKYKNYADFFYYLYVSTAGEEDEDDDEQILVPMEINPPTFQSEVEPPKITRKKIMTRVHKEILPKVLAPRGWKKVCDKDNKPTYRALYFNIIPKNEGEDEDTYIRRVSEIRSVLRDEVDKLKRGGKVNFKINVLLSKPFRYY